MKRMRMISLVALLLAGTVALCQDERETVSASASELTPFRVTIYGGTSPSGIHPLGEPTEAGRVKEIFELSEWEDAKVDMIRRPDYRVVLFHPNPADDEGRLVYALWIASSRKHDVEAIIEGRHKYTRLPVEHSSWLIPLLEENERQTTFDDVTIECRSSYP